MKICKNCSATKSDKGLYCKPCGYKNRKRPSGLTYKIKLINRAWFNKGHSPWHINTKGLMKAWNSGLKGIHLSPSTEFKYKNGFGYRHLIGKTLPDYCVQCGENNIKRLHVHHIDRCRDNNKVDNLKVLCRPCHLQVHGRIERVYVEGRKAVV